MANPDPSRTEKPTTKRIVDARKDGQVLTSPDVSSFVILLGGLLLLIVTVPMLHDGFNDTFRMVLNADCRHSWDSQTVNYGANLSAMILLKLCAPIMFGCCLLSAIVMRAQVGKYFSTGPLKWKFDSFKMNGVKQLLPNKANLMKLLLTIGKILLIGVITYITIRADYEEILGLPHLPVYVSATWMLKRFLILLLRIIGLFAIIAVIDYIQKRKQYYDKLMMTKQEVKDERKNAEGDPQIKAKIKSKMRQLLMMKMIMEIPKADVVVTNPTHVAVALKYSPGSPAPIVVAKGLRKRALRIKMIAKQHNVPIIEAPPLARSLYRTTKIGNFIPPELFGAVAAILAKLHQQGLRSYDLLNRKVG